MAKRREMKDIYHRNKERIEGIINKFFKVALDVRVFKGEDHKVKAPEDTLYYGFDKEGFHYTIRRDKI